MIPDFRKLLDDAKQRRVHMELTFEQCPKSSSRQVLPHENADRDGKMRVDADGSPAVIPERYKTAYQKGAGPYLTECMNQCTDS